MKMIDCMVLRGFVSCTRRRFGDADTTAVERMLQNVDTDDSGQITKDEFHKMMSRKLTKDDTDAEISQVALGELALLEEDLLGRFDEKITDTIGRSYACFRHSWAH